MIKLYTYTKCGTCKKAVNFLNANNISFIEHPIRETPPSLSELETMLKAYDGDIKKLFNVSGQDYRNLDMKTTLPTLSESEALKLLSENGNLVKRPFCLSEKGTMVGFKEADWEQAFLSA